MGSFKSIIVIVLVLLSAIDVQARRIGNLRSQSDQAQSPKKDSMAKPDLYRVKKMHKRADPLQIAGSSLPDCTHACGSCTPCRLVMVSLVCSSLEEAETCPMAYKCMCKNKSYPVP